MTGQVTGQGSWHDPTRQDWDRQPERGSAGLARFMIWLNRTLGWRVGYALLYPITLYFFLWSRGARRNSRTYLSRALGRPARAGDIFRQYFAFAAVILDRVDLLAGRTRNFAVTLVGLEHLTDRLEAGGCLLFGAHIGSFEILRAVAPRDRRLTIKALMHRNAVTPLTGALERLNPALREDVIEIGAMDAMLKVRDWLAAGAVVGVLADRAPAPGELAGGRRLADRRTELPFFGAAASFPTGPWILAAALEAPVVLFFGLWTGPRRYEIRFEAFADRIALGPARRDDLRSWVARYAARLEACCRARPYNWFNLYNFWNADAGRDGARGGFLAAGADADAGVGAHPARELRGGAQHRPADRAGA